MMAYKLLYRSDIISEYINTIAKFNKWIVL